MKEWKNICLATRNHNTKYYCIQEVQGYFQSWSMLCYSYKQSRFKWKSGVTKLPSDEDSFSKLYYYALKFLKLDKS